jgi:hypothetical protein
VLLLYDCIRVRSSARPVGHQDISGRAYRSYQLSTFARIKECHRLNLFIFIAPGNKV